MEIERLAEHEAERLRAIRLRALREAPDAFGSTLDETAQRPVEDWRSQLSSMPTFVAVRDRGDVGMVRCAPDRDRPDTMLLLSMWVAPEARGEGVGDALVEAIVACARHAGVRRLLLDVADRNAPAIALYSRHGFAPTGEVGALPEPREHISEHRRELRIA